MSLQDINNKLARMQFNAKRRGVVYRKLAKFLRNGVPLPTALQIMWEHASDDGKRKSDPSAVALKDWLAKISNGLSVGRAVEGWVPENDRILIEAGDKAGGLADAIDNAMFMHEASKKMTAAIIGGLAYPALLVCLAIGFMILFGVRIIPSFEEVMPRDKWTGLAANMADFSDFVNHALFPILGAVTVLIVLMLFSFPRWVGPIRTRFDHYPPYSMYRLHAGTGFMLATGALVKAGVQVPEILRIFLRSATPYYDERITAALRWVSNGVNLGEALYRSKMDFPDRETVKELRSYAELDNFDENLIKIGHQCVDESVERISNQASILRNLAFVFLGVVFGTIALGIFAIQQQVVSNI